jgi:two-component system LytT family response regulator
VRVLLVDDERLARVALRRLLKLHQDVEVVGEATNADEAAIQIAQLQPDAVFLDVEMPGKSGLELLDGLSAIPPVIFTTAYQNHAVRAFEVNALDYLLKPIVQERLRCAMDRLRESIALRKASRHESKQIFLREAERCWLVEMNRIYALESEGNYTRVYFDGNRPLIYSSLNAFEARLDPAVFFRVSRTHILNLRKIVSLDRQPNGALIAALNKDLIVSISRRRSRRLRRLLALDRSFPQTPALSGSNG